MNDHFAQAVTVDDVLVLLSTGNVLNSSWEPMVSRALLGTPAGGALHDAQEEGMLRVAAVIRCAKALEGRDKPKWGQMHALPKLVSELRHKYTWGQVAVEVLSRYEPFATSKPNEALTRVYVWCSRNSETWAPLVPHDGEPASELFATGKRMGARRKVAELVADCVLLVDRHVQVWRSEQARAAKAALRKQIKLA